MLIPLPVRLAFFYALVLGLALWFFGYVVYRQAEQRAYHDLDMNLSSRAASVRLGKDIFAGYPGGSGSEPRILNSVDALGTGGVAIEVLAVQNSQYKLLATTTGNQSNATSSVDSSASSPIPWDAQAIRYVRQHSDEIDHTYSTITYQGQQVRVYTLLNSDFGSQHFIQTARSEQDIEQSLSDLRLLLLRGGAFVMALALVGGWCITRGALAAVRRMTKTAQSISVSQDFSKRVPSTSLFGRDELVTLADTFNQMLVRLEEVYERQQRFIADASHELRAPITSIRCNLDLLAKAPDLPTEEVHAALTDARTETARMGRLVNDLLLLAHADATQHYDTSVANDYKNCKKKMQEVDLDSLLLEVFRQYHPSSNDGQQQGPRLLLQHIAPVRVFGDADQLKQALVALLDNALKYTPYEGHVTLSLVTEDDNAVVKVSDTGIGILPEDIPLVFERFYRADRARTRNRGGSGLGLSIVQSIVQEHGGSIEVESTPGKGSAFTLRLPQSP